MSFSVSQIINRFINVHEHVQNKDGEWIPKGKSNGNLIVQTGFQTDIEESSDRTLYESEKPCVIESFEWGCETDDLYPMLYTYNDPQTSNYNGNLFTSLGSLARGYLNPSNVVSRGSSYFDAKIYDSDSGVYSMKLSRPITMPKGFKLFIRNSSSTDIHQTTWSLVVRELE